MASRLALALSLCVAVLCNAPASAQQLARLHVQSFTLSSDTPAPNVDVPFNVTLFIRVHESVKGPFENVILPPFSGVEELGDERVLLQSAHGTTYRETLRLVAHARGALTIASAYLDAIDARDGKPKRFFSNDLHLNVAGGPLLDVWAPVRVFVRVLIQLILLCAALFVIVTLFRRRRTILQQTVLQSVPEPAPKAPESDAVSVALDALRTQRTRDAVLRVRTALWAHASAPAGATLQDVLRFPAARDSRIRTMLTLAERAAFIEESHIQDAIDDLLEERTRSIA